MSKWVIEENIRRFKALLSSEIDETQRELLRRLLAEQCVLLEDFKGASLSANAGARDRAVTDQAAGSSGPRRVAD